MPPQPVPPIEEASIEDLQTAIQSGALSCRELVQTYLDRIEIFDKQGPSLNAIVVLNPKALDTADDLDRRLARSGPAGILHGIPIIVKDNYNTAGLPTTAGSLSLKTFIPTRDAFHVRKLREAGAIILAKSNMAEFAWSAYETLSSILPGPTRNPYATHRVPAGSSGGTAAAVAAGFGAVGLGTDTGNSIRGPSSHTALVGIRSTRGLTSRDGIVPLNLEKDIGGPMARTVSDAACILDLIAGHDPFDPVTRPCRDRTQPVYRDALLETGLRGARIGVLRQLFTTDTAHPEIIALLEAALTDLGHAGAVLIDPVEIAALKEIPPGEFWFNRFRADIDAYLKAQAGKAPVRNLEEIIASGNYHPSIDAHLRKSRDQPAPEENPERRKALQHAQRLREETLNAMDGRHLDALVYPTWNNPPRLIGDLNSPHGNNSPLISPHTGFPALTVPMGFTQDALPAGLQILGRPWSEPVLIRLAYAYEQHTRHRRPPTLTPTLNSGQSGTNG